MSIIRKWCYFQREAINSKQSEEMSRLEYIDVYKCILIGLVVIGHSNLCSTGLHRFIYSFHMAAFFAAYGMTYNFESHYLRSKRWQDLVLFSTRKARRLIIPYFVWALFYNTLTFENLGRVFYGSSQSLTEAGGLTSLWFLPSYYISIVLFEIIVFLCGRIRHLRKRNCLICVLIILCFGTVGFLLPRLNKTGYPWGINIGILACSFIGIGYITNVLFNKIELLRHSVFLFLLFIISFLILYFTNDINTHVSVAKFRLGNPLLFFLNVLAGVICVFSISIIISKHLKKVSKKCICYIGMNTMGVFLIHKNLQNRIVAYSEGEGINRIVLLLLIAIITIILCTGITWLILKICPELLGEKKKSFNNVRIFDSTENEEAQ